MKKVMPLLLTIIFVLSITGCNDKGAGDVSASSQISSQVSESSVSEPDVSSEEAIPSSEISGTSPTNEATQIPEIEEAISVGALKGPTAMGMVNIMDKDYGQDAFTFTRSASPDELTPKIVQGEVDIAAIPANLASVLYNKTDGKIKVISINTLGVLYIVENGDSVNSVEDLRGKTIFASGKGASPEYTLKYLLSENGIDPDTDVNIEFKSEHAECVTSLVSTENSVALLPEPFVTSATVKNPDIKVKLDITQEWKKLTGEDSDEELITGVTVARTEFIENHPDLVGFFLKEQLSSSTAVNENVQDAAALMEKNAIRAAAVAEKAMPKWKITCITGEEMKLSVAKYLDILNGYNPQAVGSSVPGDDFYYFDEQE